MVIKLSQVSLQTSYGPFEKILYYDGLSESVALVKGKVEGKKGVLCRIHSACISAHAFNSVECDCREQMAASQAAIEHAGAGIIIWLEQEGKGNGHLGLMQSIPHKKAGMPQPEAYAAAGFSKDNRDYRPAAQILKELGIASVTLLTGNSKKASLLKEYGFAVEGIQEV